MYDSPHALTFAQEAMATAFRLTLVEPDPRYARQAAAAAFAELDEIENRLSRYVETSDLFRINRLGRGQATTVHVDTFQCLRIALEVQAATGGAFDAAYASAVRPAGQTSLPVGQTFSSVGQTFLSANSSAGKAPGGEPLFELIEAGCAVRVLADGVRLYLGGIGKGFALDRMAGLLREWDILAAMLCASTSTVLALDGPPGEPGWPVKIGADQAPEYLCLANQAASASGTAVRGAHIVDPRTGRPAEARFRAWAVAPTAAEADALSTAFMVMGEDEIRDYCRRRPEISARLLQSPAAELG
jgi:FAD:protein FMN transferase